MATAKKRVAIYARVSTSEQNQQLRLDELRDSASRREWTIVAEHVDHGVNGPQGRP